MLTLTNTLSSIAAWHNKYPLKSSLAFFLFLTVIAGMRYFSGLDTVVYQCDEYSYLRKSFFLDLYLKGKFSDPRWQSGDATDQTKLMEYVYGLPSNLLYGKSFLELAQEEGERFHESYINYADWAVSYGQPASNLNISPKLRRVLLAGRMISAMFTVIYLFLATLSLYWLFRESLLLGGLGFLFLLFQPTIAIHGRQVLADSALNAFLVVGLLGQFAWWRALWQAKRPNYNLLFLALVLGVVGGLAAATKLNGFLYLILTEMLFGLGLVLKAGHTKRIKRWFVALGLSALLTATVTFLVFFSLHPNTWSNPVGGLKRFFEWRWWITEYYQGYFPEDNISSWPQKVNFIILRTAGYMPGVGSIGFHYEGRYGNPSPLWYAIPNLFLLIFGIITMGKRLIIKKEYQTLITPAFVWSFGLLVLVGLYLKLDWTRYYWPLFVPVAIIDSFGLMFLGNQLKKLWRRNR